MNHTRFPKEIHLPNWARRDNKVTKGDRVDSIFRVVVRNSTLRMEAVSHTETSETDHCNMVGNPPKIRINVHPNNGVSRFLWNVGTFADNMAA